jgi:pyrroline-5-carboxylate reductase
VGAAVRSSTTAVVIPESVPPQDAAFAMDLFGSVGAVLHVPESLMDTVTAVGASGVAYVCRMIEAMQRGAESLGASPAVARGLALGAADAAVALLRSEPHAQPQQVRERVTSPGGTTAAAMGVLESGGFESLVMQAVQAAQDRARSLDGGSSRASGVDEPPRRP